MKTLVAIPCMDEIPYKFVESLIGLTPVGQTAIQFHSGSLIYEARNNLLKYGIEQFDYILWLDSDMTFDSDLLVKMFASLGDGEFIAAPYRSRRMPHHWTCYSKCGYIQKDGFMDCEFEYIDDMPKDKFEIAACGFGCVLMKASLGQRILENQGLPFAPLPGYGEDLSFCIKARQADATLMMDPTIKLGHIGTVVIDEDYVKMVHAR